MNIWPDIAPDSFIEMRKKFQLVPTFSGDTFKELAAYPVIVERWDKRRFGRGRKAYLAAFTTKERNKLTKWHAKFYRWYLVTGTPRVLALRLTTLELLKRAVAFFATI